ncbi:Similar to S.cerevisiae protein BUR6 (Subunit of a heterodimeric NC2 transcription regulator complex) [Malassezia sympodialis ATCC 42132]|uniref:Similar to S.cerevisiae protein BUR6 (Subunit of a heterodimeric NC2 transcription regulator complex) n=1 Tax=Malassezia sympodialis (strain ATCC 42132) TaxID=1230383 RepID=A0A1M8A320_MALS4|nr:Similar to S.cerevisiae protein BUR6 (Subunit of a heterodimeric NC2 transcription regulator complex) [Malassezia sympodialis ATCC 42132]
MVKRSTTSKFPIARIKRIMQADEDVGKVAQATPVVISKALELFMQDIVEKAAEQTRSTGGKRVSPYHLKRAAQATEMFDFLKDIVDKVPDPLESGGARTSKRRKVTRSEPKAEDEADEVAKADEEANEGAKAEAPVKTELPASPDAAPTEPPIKESDDSEE